MSNTIAGLIGFGIGVVAAILVFIFILVIGLYKEDD